MPARADQPSKFCAQCGELGNLAADFGQPRAGFCHMRPFSLALDFIRDGDTLIVTRLDRLARSVIDLHQIIAKVVEKGAAFRVLQQAGIDTSTSTGKLTLAVLGPAFFIFA